jgi:LuxR family maltose regulon positive regulatory protein
LRPLMDIHIGLADAYLNIVGQDWASVRTVLARIKPYATQLRRNKDLLQIHLLDALACKKLGLEGETMFRECLVICGTLDLARLVRDTHPHLEEWERSMNQPQGLTESAQAPASAPAPPTRSKTSVAPSVLLTPKERDVIQLLANNLSNKEIALALDMSVETVKWHLKNLFAKLNAGGRKHVVDRARMLGLLIRN